MFECIEDAVYHTERSVWNLNLLVFCCVWCVCVSLVHVCVFAVAEELEGRGTTEGSLSDKKEPSQGQLTHSSAVYGDLNLCISFHYVSFHACRLAVPK